MENRMTMDIEACMYIFRLHDYLYKKSYLCEIGQCLHDKYEAGEIRNENEFKEVLKNVLSDCKK